MEKNMLSDCEQMVMKCIWNSDVDMGVQEITDTVNKKYNKEWKIQTVSTFLARLVKKEYISMYRKGRTFFYQPLIEEEVYKKSIMHNYIEFWNAGNVADFVCSICEGAKFTEEEKKEIKEMIDELD